MAGMAWMAALAAAAVGSAPQPAGLAAGEEAVFEVRYLGLPAGEARISIGQPAGPIWPVIFQARTAGLSRVFDVREHVVSYWDAQTGLPRASELRALELGDAHVDRADYDRVRNQATLAVERKGVRSVRVVDVPPGAQDVASAFVWLRQRPLAPGERYEIPIRTTSADFAMVAEVRGREQVETPAGAFRAVRVGVRTRFTGPFSTERESTLWLTDDPRHLLVRASMDFALGSVVASLTRYHAGAAVVAEGAPPAN